MSKKKNKRIVIAVDMSRPNGQRQFNGLMRYLHSHHIRWDMRIKRAISECLVGQVDEFLAWDIDGVIYAQPQHSHGQVHYAPQVDPCRLAFRATRAERHQLYPQELHPGHFPK